MSGYSVHEPDPWGKDLVVRSRHAHAWAQAYIDGKWINVDTTPPFWPDFESNRAGFLQPVGDLWSWCRFRLSHWFYNNEEGKNSVRKYLIWLSITVFVIIAGMFSRKKRVKQEKVTKIGPIKERVLPGADSPFYLVEERINSMGFIRGRPESLTIFLERVRRAGPVNEACVKSFEELLSFHYRYRFDPRGMSPEERLVFMDKVRDWLKKVDDPA